MTSERDGKFGFAAAHDAPIPYLQRIRDYYQALGYGAPYEWAHYAEVPFRPLDKPLSECRVAAGHHGGALSAGQGRSGSRRAVQCGGQVLHRLLGRHGARTTTCASRMSPSTASTPRPKTPATYFPLPRCAAAATAGRIGVGRAALSWRPDQSQPSSDARGRLARRSSRAARPTRSMPRSWFPTAPSATRP